MKDPREYLNNRLTDAAALGLQIVVPAPNELFVDIDDAESNQIFIANLPKLAELVDGYRRAPSPSGRPDRFHITVTLSRPVADEFERIMLQSLLGSDQIREGLGYMRARLDMENPTVFFEKPAAEATP